MNETIINKLKELLSKVKNIKSSLCLFVIVRLRGINRWDLILGGKDMEGDENLKLILKLIKETFSKEEIILFSRLQLLNANSPFVKSMNSAFKTEGGDIKIANSKIDNFLIEEAHLFYSNIEGQ